MIRNALVFIAGMYTLGFLTLQLVHHAAAAFNHTFIHLMPQ